MYRDRASALDEHDRAVGSIQIADGLIADCLAAAAKLQGPDRPARWRTATAIGDDYLEIWRQLDTARDILASRGVNTLGYDELRADVQPVLRVDDDGVARPFDRRPFDNARRSLEELRLAIPGADWAAIAKRTIELVHEAPLGDRGMRLRAGAILGIFGTLVVTWASAMMPEPPTDPDLVMRQEIRELVIERRHRIDELQTIVGQRCDRLRVHELMKLYVMDGRFDDARWFGDSYELRCGADPTVHKWAYAPRPKRPD